MPLLGDVFPVSGEHAAPSCQALRMEMPRFLSGNATSPANEASQNPVTHWFHKR